ncbi:MAG TPA: hypothetical protein VI306_00610 [Pyrinomonadaceae bacterium]
MKRIVFFIATFVFVISACLSLILVWRLSRPGFRAFPSRVHGMHLTEGPRVQKTDGGLEVYLAAYSEVVVHYIQPRQSAADAKAFVDSQRASLQQQNDAAVRAGKPEVFRLSKLDQPGKNLLIDQIKDSNNWNITWSNGNWACSVIYEDAPRPPGEDPDAGAQQALDFAASLPYGPQDVTPRFQYSDFTLFGLIGNLSSLIKFWWPALVPGIFALLMVPVMLLTRRRKSTPASS